MRYDGAHKTGVCDGSCKESGENSRCSLGSTDKATPAFAPLDLSEPSAGLQIIYTGHDTCMLSGPQTQFRTVLEIECDESAGDIGAVELSWRDPLNPGATMTSPSCSLGVRLKSSAGCPTLKTNTFQLVVIVALLLLVAYCTIGIAWNKRRGTTGFESVPHIDFWRDLRDLAVDGCAFALGRRRDVADPSGKHTLLVDDEEEGASI